MLKITLSYYSNNDEHHSFGVYKELTVCSLYSGQFYNESSNLGYFDLGQIATR